LECILNCQILDKGELTAWCQQHDNLDFSPCNARRFEPAAICKQESAEVMKFLMTLRNPSEKIIFSINSAVRWFEVSKIFGIRKVIVYLDPAEFKSTWLGNKSIYRTRIAIDDGGELIVIAPGLKEFGEDKEIERLIRKFGYVTTPEVLQSVKENDELKNSLSAAAHLIHGSSENRFKITYCPGYLANRGN
jgi:hypothetical protein